MDTGHGRLFDELNRRYWRGRLPKYRIIRLPEQTMGGWLGVCRDRTKVILVRDDLIGEELRLTLLHEMCHIGTGEGYSHGPRFLRKMRRIAAAGELRLTEDVERYDGTQAEREIAEAAVGGSPLNEISFRDAVQGDLESLALEHPGLPWKRVRKLIAEQYRLSPSQFTRSAGWAAREWRRLGSESRRLRRSEGTLRRTLRKTTPATS